MAMPEFMTSEQFRNTKVYLFHGVPLDDTYTDVIHFTGSTSEVNRANFFINNQKWHLCTFNGDQTAGHNVYINGAGSHGFYSKNADFSYQRMESSIASPRRAYSIRVPIAANKIVDCNYMIIRNPITGDPQGYSSDYNKAAKFYYCFVKQVNYINPNNTELIYEIDEFNTWFYDTDVEQCMVLREHVTTDSYFSNTTPEPVDIPKIVVANSELVSMDTLYQDVDRKGYIIVVMKQSVALNIIIQLLQAITGVTIIQGCVGNQFVGVPIASIPITGNEDRIKSLFQDNIPVDALAAVFMSPLPAVGGSTPNIRTVSYTTKTIRQRPESINGYKPKNKKLFCSIFRTINISTMETGEMIELKPELLESPGTEDHQFTVRLDLSVNPNMVITPYKYAGLRDNENTMLQYSGVIQCLFTAEPFLQNMISTASNAIMSYATAGMARTFLTQNYTRNNDQIQMRERAIVTRANTGWIEPTKMVGNIFGETLKTIDIKGHYSSPLTSWTRNLKGFLISESAPPREFLKKYDDYFTMYGYEVDELKVPAMTSRPYWNYIKTQNAEIIGSIPVGSMETIKEMFNNGIRLWHTSGQYVPQIGNYSLDNSPS